MDGSGASGGEGFHLAAAGRAAFHPESGASGSGDPVTPLFRAQPEHTIGKSRSAGAAENYYRPGDAERPTKVRMAADKDSCDAQSHTERHTQPAIRSS
jgi:hypothetical protein